MNQPFSSPGGYPRYVPPRPYVESGGFWARLGASLIDGLVIGIPFAIAMVVLVASIARQDPEPCTVDGRLALCENPTGAGWVILGVAALAAFVGFLAYIGILEGRRGATIGRRTVGLGVVTADSVPVGGAAPPTWPTQPAWPTQQAWGAVPGNPAGSGPPSGGWGASGEVPPPPAALLPPPPPPPGPSGWTPPSPQ